MGAGGGEGVNSNSIGVKKYFIVFFWGGDIYTMSLYWPPYWSKVNKKYQTVRQYQTEKFVILNQCHYCANTGTFLNFALHGVKTILLGLKRIIPLGYYWSCNTQNPYYGRWERG